VSFQPHASVLHGHGTARQWSRLFAYIVLCIRMKFVVEKLELLKQARN
jgi:sigma54-dependent transcription regulator